MLQDCGTPQVVLLCKLCVHQACLTTLQHFSFSSSPEKKQTALHIGYQLIRSFLIKLHQKLVIPPPPPPTTTTTTTTTTNNYLSIFFPLEPLTSTETGSHVCLSFSWQTRQQRNTNKLLWTQMGVSKNRGTPKSSILIGCSIINHPLWRYQYFWKHPNRS